jgi:hypothetical protein
MAVEWTITIEGRNEFGDVCRKAVRIDKSRERLVGGDLGLAIDDGKTIMTTLQSAVVNHEAEAYALFRRVCPDCHRFRPVKDYTTRQIRTVFGTVEVRNPRWMICRDCYPGMVVAFAPLKEICPDRATSELMELTARLGSMMPYRQAASVLAEFLPVEPTETHATVRKRTIRIGERLDDQVAEEELRARAQTDERRQLEMQLPGDRRKEFVISIDTAHVRSTDPQYTYLRIFGIYTHSGIKVNKGANAYDRRYEVRYQGTLAISQVKMDRLSSRRRSSSSAAPLRSRRFLTNCALAPPIAVRRILTCFSPAVGKWPSALWTAPSSCTDRRRCRQPAMCTPRSVTRFSYPEL